MQPGFFLAVLAVWTVKSCYWGTGLGLLKGNIKTSRTPSSQSSPMRLWRTVKGTVGTRWRGGWGRTTTGRCRITARFVSTCRLAGAGCTSLAGTSWTVNSETGFCNFEGTEPILAGQFFFLSNHAAATKKQKHVTSCETNLHKSIANNSGYRYRLFHSGTKSASLDSHMYVSG